MPWDLWIRRLQSAFQDGLITYRNRNDIQYITQVGTGNYNEKTAAMYTDLSLMTADPRIGRDAAEFFKNMSIGNLVGSYQYLIVSPVSLKSRILQMMDEEIKKEAKGRIIMKMNSVTDVDFIKKVSEASCAGVRVDLIVRWNLLYTTGSAWIYGKCQSDECGWPLSRTSTYLQLRNRQRAEDLYRLRRHDDKKYRKKSRSSLPGIRRADQTSDQP